MYFVPAAGTIAERPPADPCSAVCKLDNLTLFWQAIQQRLVREFFAFRRLVVRSDGASIEARSSEARGDLGKEVCCSRLSDNKQNIVKISR